MTPEERAKKLVVDHPIQYSLGSKHYNLHDAVRLIAAAITEAVEEEREGRLAAEAELAELKSAIESAGLFVNDYGHVMRQGKGHDQ